ncbi:MAG: hypothetical protein ABR915_21900 [Thermoguttaceae bacterium]|jgi:REP element-mobilizing transposase RayT
MPRPPRPIADGLIYHVINRGNNRQPVFLADGDYLAFLKAVADHKEHFFICLQLALDTTRKWNLKHHLGDKLKAF